MTDAIGADNSNNAFASTNVTANADGSVLERVEYVQTKVNNLSMPASTESTVNTANDTITETTVIDNTTAKGHIQVYVDLTNATTSKRIRTYRTINGNSRLVKTLLWSTSDPVGYYTDIFLTNDGMKVTIQNETSAEAVSIGYELINDNRA